MSAVYVEQDCTIEHEGRVFESGGAVVTDGWLVAYPAAGGVLSDWHGRPIGTWTEVSRWRVDSWQGTYMHAMRCTVNGRRYHGRGFGVGMILRAKACKANL